MPRFTSMPSRSSSAMRLAMTVCASITYCVTRQSTSTAGVITWSGEIIPTGTMCSASTMTVVAAIAITGLKLRAVSA